MDFLFVRFPVSGVETFVLLPPFVAFGVSLLTSMGGVSGAFLLLPYQVSFLHFTSPSVSATNFVYNICAIPSGVYRYIREGRMVWPLAFTVVAGTLPGVFLGYHLRVQFLPDPQAFKLFVGCVLLYIGAHLFHEIVQDFLKNGTRTGTVGKESRRRDTAPGKGPIKSNPWGDITGTVVRTIRFTLKRTEYEFLDKRFSFNTSTMFILALLIGVVGGAYGIGGGSILAPICVALFNLPVYTIAGAALMSTFLTSTAGVFFYSVIPSQNGISTAPDWLLGILFGTGGFVGMYCGARLQKFVPQKVIKAMLGALLFIIGCSYIWQRFA